MHRKPPQRRFNLSYRRSLAINAESVFYLTNEQTEVTITLSIKPKSTFMEKHFLQQPYEVDEDNSLKDLLHRISEVEALLVAPILIDPYLILPQRAKEFFSMD